MLALVSIAHSYVQNGRRKTHKQIDETTAVPPFSLSSGSAFKTQHATAAAAAARSISRGALRVSSEPAKKNTRQLHSPTATGLRGKRTAADFNRVFAAAP